MKPDCLLIVDMQANPKVKTMGFPAAYNRRTVRNCRKLIQKAIERNIQIVFLEYRGYGKSHPSLTELTKDYDKTAHVTKDTDDGGSNFHDLHEKSKWKFNCIQVCGVNADACVRATVKTLVQIGYDVQVVKKACNTSSYATYYGVNKVFSSYSEAPNLAFA